MKHYNSQLELRIPRKGNRGSARDRLKEANRFNFPTVVPSLSSGRGVEHGFQKEELGREVDLYRGGHEVAYEQQALQRMKAIVRGRRSAMFEHISQASRGEHFVLGYLSRHGTSTPSTLAAALRASSGRVSAILSSMEKKGYITREIDREDRRNILVSLTDSGRKRAHDDLEETESAMRWIFSEMGQRQTQEFLDLLSEFATYMSICRPGATRPTDKEVAQAFENERKNESERSGSPDPEQEPQPEM